MIAEAKCGVSANSADVDSCVAAMRKLLSDDSKFYDIGQSGRRYAIEHFSKEVCVSQIENLLA
jgi:glycosyltransferase involved in cell wall biosynthesis